MPDPDVPLPIGRLRRRADFLRAAKGKRWHLGALTAQAAPADPARHDVRIGYTLTRKVGCAVMRNRARRRLKEATRLSPDLPVEPGRDYVIIGRVDALRMSFDRLKHELAQAIRGATHGGRRPSKDVARDESRETRPRRTRPDQ